MPFLKSLNLGFDP